VKYILYFVYDLILENREKKKDSYILSPTHCKGMNIFIQVMNVDVLQFFREWLKS
jgi:hypothetical protein